MLADAHVYGDVPRKLPGYSKETHPWLSDFRYFNKAVTFGCHMSITEMEVLSACLVDETYCKHARLFIREPSYTASKDSSFRDIEDWERSAMNNFKKSLFLQLSCNPCTCFLCGCARRCPCIAQPAALLSVVLEYASILESIITPSHIKLFRILRDGVYGRKRIGTGPCVNTYSTGVLVYVIYTLLH